MSRTQDEEIYYIEVGAWEAVRENGRTKIILYPHRSLEDLATRPTPKPSRSPRAVQMQAMLDAGVVRNRAELAENFGISRARVTQILGPMRKKGGRQ